jgi:hypothetical protein
LEEKKIPLSVALPLMSVTYSSGLWTKARFVVKVSLRKDPTVTEVLTVLVSTVAPQPTRTVIPLVIRLPADRSTSMKFWVPVVATLILACAERPTTVKSRRVTP